MENRFLARLAAALMAATLASLLPAMSAPPGYVALFNGVDLTQVLDGRQHPGLARTHGYFGFAGHNDPVAFREVAIKTLE